MAEPYQLPPAFQVPSMAEVSRYAGDSGDQEVMNNFMQQWTAATNIDNANRAQSLREREFANKVIQNDRDFQLRRDLQDSQIQANDIQFEISKWGFQKQKEKYDQLQSAWAKKDEWMATLDTLMPNGGSSSSYPMDKARAIRMLAKNQNDLAVLGELLAPYEEQFKIYQVGKGLEDGATIQAGLDNGWFDDQMVGDKTALQYWNEAKQYQLSDPDMYQAAVRNMRRLYDDKLLEQKRQKEREQQAADVGTFNALRGQLPIKEMTLEKGQIKLEAGIPRVYGAGARGTGGGGAAGVNSMRQMAELYQSRAKELEEKIPLMEEGADKMLAEAELETAKTNFKIYTDRANALSTSILPAGEGAPAPSATGAESVLPPIPTAPQPKKQQPVPSPAPSPAQPVEVKAEEKVAVVEPSTGVSPEATAILEEKGVKVSAPVAKKPAGATGRRVRTSEEIAKEKIDTLKLELDKLSKQKLGRSGGPNVIAMQGVAQQIVDETKKLEQLQMLAGKQPKKEATTPTAISKTF